MKDKLITVKEAVEMINDNSIILVGGFLGVGSPNYIIDEIMQQNIKDITLVANDTAMPEIGVGKLIVNKQIKKFIGTHIGTNPETGRQMATEELAVTLIPQGTMIEQIRAKGAGLGGVLTKTGLGTVVAKDKQTIIIDEQEYLLEKPIGADFALIYGSLVDKSGNVYYRGTTRNFNVGMAKAADIVIVEAQEIIDDGALNPNEIVIPNIYIDYIVEVPNDDK